MAHLPVNHRLRTLYRVIAGVCGLYVLVFGIAAVARTGGLDFFQQDSLPWVLGLRANRAFAVLSIGAGLLLLAATFVGRNVDRWTYLAGSVVFLVAGMAMMVLMESDANIFGFTMTTCIVSFIIGLALGLAGLYVMEGSHEQQVREERFRHGEGPDPEEHVLGADQVPRAKEEPAGQASRATEQPVT